MSILIKDMEMPTGCGHCYMFSFLSDSCRITNHVTGEMNDKMFDRRFDDCPLIELPPHGRLIDADALAVALDDNDELTTSVLSLIDDAPTIIEAEGKDD